MNDNFRSNITPRNLASETTGILNRSDIKLDLHVFSEVYKNEHIAF